MSYFNWFHNYFSKKHTNSSNEEILNDIFLMLEERSSEYLAHYYENYHDLYIDPNEDILNSNPQIIQQVKLELYDFLNLILENKAENILQIGLGHFGSTQFCLSFLCKKIVSVDLDIKNINFYSQRELLYNQNKEFFIHGDSAAQQVIDNAGKEGPYDCLLIDGNHSFEYVKKDHDNYSPLVKKGGIIAFHDALLTGERYGTPEVLKSLEEDVRYISHSKEVGIAYYKKQ
tara:strand:+ start:6001 stop:6690 length:690 start_codon:yes stop_codon:yes gene_type:complete